MNPFKQNSETDNGTTILVSVICFTVFLIAIIAIITLKTK